MSNVVIKDMGKGRYAIKGECRWAKVFQPDTRFNELGVYSVDIELHTDEDVEAVKDMLQPLAEEAFNEAVKEKAALKKQLSYADFIKERYDDDGEVVGHYVQIKQVAKVFSKKHDKWYDMKPRVVDAQGNEMDGSQLIGNGSVVAVLFEPSGYVMQSNKSVGVSLRGLRQVKVLDLVEYGSNDPLADFDGDFVADNSGGSKTPSNKPEDDSFEDMDDDEAPF